MRRIVPILFLASAQLYGQADFVRLLDEGATFMDPSGYTKPEFTWDMEGKAQASLNEAINLLDEGKPDQALGELDEAYKSDNDAWPIFYYRGVVLKMLGENGRAERILLEADRMKPKNFNINIELGKVSELLKKQGAADGYYEKAADIDTKNALPHFMMGAAFSKTDRLVRGKKSFARCVEVDSTFQYGEVMLAIIESYEKKNPKSAIKRLEGVLVKDSVNRLALIYHAGLVYDDNPKAALKDFDVLVRHDPTNIQFRFFRGRLATQLREFDNAFRDLRKVVDAFEMDESRHKGRQTTVDKQLDLKYAGYYVVANVYGLPDEDAAHIKKAYCLFFTGEFDESLRVVGHVEGAPTNPLCLYLKGVANEHKGNHRVAWMAYDSALKFDNDIYDAHKKRGIYYTELKQWRSAAEDFNEMLRINPRSISALRFRGIAYYRLGKLVPALQDFTKYLAVDSASQEVRGYRGVVYDGLGDILASTLDLLGSDQRGGVRHRDIIYLEIRKLTETNRPKAMWYIDEFIKLDYSSAYTMKLSLLMDGDQWVEAEALADELIPKITAEIPGLIINETDASNEINDASARVFTAKGMCLAHRNNDDEALQQFERALKVYYRSGPALLERGKLYLKLGNKKKAKRDLSAAYKFGMKEAGVLLAEAEE